MAARTCTLLFAVIVLLSACGRKDGQDTAVPPPEVVVPHTADAASPIGMPSMGVPAALDPLLTDAQSRAASIDASLANLTAQTRQQVYGDIKSDVSAYLSGTQIVLIKEKMLTTDNSQSTNKYYFDNGSLFLYQDDGSWLEINPPNPLVTKNVKREMVFNSAGKLLTALKSVDGGPAALSEHEAVAVVSHVQYLLGAMKQPTPVATPAAPATESTTAVAIPAPEAVPATAAPEPQPVPATAAAPAPVTGDEGTGDRIKLMAGKKSTQLRGTAPVNGTRDYVVRAKAGQLMTLSLEGSPSAVFAVYSSRGEIVADLTNWSSKMPRDEDYTIKVGQTKGASGPADFVLNVKVE